MGDEDAAVLRELGAAVRDFKTDGPNCHWCYHRPTAYVWCPYSTHVCEYCHDRIEAGNEWDVVEAHVGATKIRQPEAIYDLEAWREREHDLMRRWLAVRTHAHRIQGDEIEDPRHVETFDD